MLRKRKNKRYNEESNDDHEEGTRTYNLKEKIRCERFEQLEDLQDLPGETITLKWVQRNGFEKPILVKTPSGLDLRVPPKSFLVKDVGKLVGHERMIDVMDVVTQKNIEMSMKDWCKYYESRNRDRLLNVISLEFSHTDLDDLVESPKIVKLLDWVDLIWPKFLKESQTESTNTIDKMKYPKVQKYCLMSVKGSYTDFHIDFGGTSVWYHILRGKKIFWMCPPTELNLQAFEEWTLSGFQQDIFFGDTVEKCFRVELCAGNTFFIPSGWIHAVYTLEDSLVFGGNFLHSFGIENQLKVARIEDATKVPIKFRYPFYTEMLWYVVQHYVYCLTGKSHLHNSSKNSINSTPEKQTTTLSVKHHEDAVTESEQDESDSKKKKETTTTTTTNQPRKRGRPPKSASKKPPKKPPTDDEDDESTEIDSDLEEKKPAKNTATCRMTKNSLLRLQYEIEDTVKTTTTTSTTSKVTKVESSQIEKPEVKSTTAPKKTAAASLTKPMETKPLETKPNKVEVTTPNTDESRKFSLSDLVMPETAPINGWSLGQASSNQGIWSNRDSESKEPLKIHITKYELNGLRHLVKHLSKLSGVKKNLPTLIRNSRALLDDCKKVIVEHENDDPELAATGVTIGPELLNPKKSDINQLIEQFFKPSETTANDGSANLISPNALSKSDSTTLTHQQRLKYNNNQTVGTSDSSKEEKKITPKVETTNTTMSPRREIKQQQVTSANKKFLTSLPPSLASTAAATTPSSSSSDEPRPKSPPTRPLSNKQYTSKTKKDNNLVLPGSFADLIAATSTAKEVFEVSSTDVTSTLFGLKPPTSPNKSSAQQKSRERQNSIDALTRSDSTQDTIAQTTNTTSHPPTSATSAKESAPRPNSPEPPKISPPKRFINPAYKPQNKEKLIFASAPYVSPISVSEQSKSTGLYPWQSPAPSYPPPPPPSNQHHTHHAPTHHQHHHQAKHSSDNSNSNNNFSVISSSKQTTTHESSSIAAPQPYTKQDVKKTPNTENSITAPKPPTTPLHPATSEAKEGSNSKAFQAPAAKHDKAPKIEKQHPPDTSQHVKQESTESRPTSDGGQPTSEVKKLPKGPPKKSKEARLILTSEVPLTASAPVIKLNQPVQSTSVIQSGPSVTAAQQQPMALAAVANSVVASDKEKPKSKRAKKQKDETANQGAQDLPTATLNLGALAPGQTRPPVICGLIRPPVSSAGNVASNSQQYLITRPLLFNPAPSHPSARAQTLPRTSMPIFSTPVPASMGLPNMQPGTRIVWATRPGGLPIVSNANPTISNAPTAVSTANPSAPKAKSNAQKSTPPAPNTAGHMDNAALLSLATTALSTAPLSTTPTLSHMGARIPNVSQALMVNPMAPGQQALFAGQQFFNPFLQRMPMVQFAPRPAHPGQVIPSALPRPGGAMPRSTGQLFFAPLPNQPGQPRYLITQPGFLPQRPNASHLFVGHPPTTSAAHSAFPPAAVNSTKESVKVKKVKTR